MDGLLDPRRSNGALHMRDVGEPRALAVRPLAQDHFVNPLQRRNLARDVEEHVRSGAAQPARLPLAVGGADRSRDLVRGRAKRRRAGGIERDEDLFLRRAEDRDAIGAGDIAQGVGDFGGVAAHDRRARALAQGRQRDDRPVGTGLVR